MDEQKVAELNRIIRECKHIVFFGGAGVSTESGIPDFRSKDGLYNQHDVKFDRYSPEYLLSIDCLVDHPDVFYEFYRQKLNTAGIEPNRTHYKLAEMEKAGKTSGLRQGKRPSLPRRSQKRAVRSLPPEYPSTPVRGRCWTSATRMNAPFPRNRLLHICIFRIPDRAGTERPGRT